MLVNRSTTAQACGRGNSFVLTKGGVRIPAAAAWDLVRASGIVEFKSKVVLSVFGRNWWGKETV